MENCDIELEDVVDELPLDRLEKEYVKDDVTTLVPALHKCWVEPMNYENYITPYKPEEYSKMLPQDIVVINEQWVEKMTILNEDLEWLLEFPHYQFWSHAVFDREMRTWLGVFLSQAPRYFDPVNPYLSNEMVDLLQEISKNAFLVFLRLATYKENQSCHITPAVFGRIIYENFLFDIPKLMDLCVIYYEGNSSTLHKMIGNIFQNQPNYQGDLVAIVPNIKKALNNVRKKLGLENSVADMKEIKNGRITDIIEEMPWMQLQDVIYFLVDICATLSAFLDVYQEASSVFKDFTSFLTNFYDTVLPVVLNELDVRQRNENWYPVIEPTKKLIFLTKSNCIKIVRNVVTTCYIQAIFDSNAESKAELVDSFLNFLISQLSDSKFMSDYVKQFPLEEDIHMITQTQVSYDQVKVEYLKQGAKVFGSVQANQPVTPKESTTNSVQSENCVKTSKPTSNSKDYEVPDIDDCVEQNGYAGACASKAVTGAALASLITQVKDLLSDLGDGFVEACLEYYNYIAEDVIHAILDDNLPLHLSSMDRKMAPRTKQNEIPKEDDSESASSLLTSRKNIFDNDEFDIFNRKDVDMSRIHKGKRNDPHTEMAALDDKSHLQETKHKYQTYRNVIDLVQIVGEDLYDDEYDDTYDENDVGTTIENTQDELLSIRPFTTPRVLRKGNEESESEEEEQPQVSPAEPRRDQFVENPEDVRKRREERWQAKQQLKYGRRSYCNSNNNSPRDVKGNPKGQGQSDDVKRNRAKKERNKSKGGDHSRRFFSDRKRSGGMIPS